MSRTLLILEVSGKQDYIFSGKKLRENAERSAEIAYVTGGDFFREAAGALYNEDENLVYGGGGHTILQFPDRETAALFGQKVSEAVLRTFPGMELFLKQLPYEESMTTGENLKSLSLALEKKKALRLGSFDRRSWGVEKLDSVTHRPARKTPTENSRACQPAEPPEGWQYPAVFEELCGKDNFLAVVHIDGNGMGARAADFYAAQGGAGDWESFRHAARRFSEGIQQDFEDAFRETAAEIAGQRELWSALEPKEGCLPLRPVILAGDDVCFVAAGSLGLSCARSFLEKLSAKTNREDGKPYAACAGVALVHRKYPFHAAYDLAEELCSSAKQFGAKLDARGRISAMDWHIDFGQLKDSLEDIREDYATEDGGQLELRPVTVCVPKDLRDRPGEGVRSWAFFRGLCAAMQGEYGKVARSKIKDLRTALKQGETETRFFLQDKGVSAFLDHCFDAEYAEESVQEAFRQLREAGALRKEPFRELDGVKRCLLFDAIEMIDHCLFLKEAEK